MKTALLGANMQERDRNGYAIVKVGTRKFYITPYNEFFAVRNVQGSIERDRDRQQLIFQTEDEAISYLIVSTT
jgi:hypothetical protein